ncbi:MAG: transporter, transrane region, type 1 [Marmoricola sp.]|nr:transporter, transrane region, type 1 [Marmoricola sp.]
MKPTDPRVLAQLAPARTPLGLMVGSGLVSSVLVIGQAFALTAVIVAAVGRTSLVGPLVALAVVVASKVAVGAISDIASAHAAARVSASMRTTIATAVLAGGVPALSEGETAALATRGVSAAEPYLTRYLPTLVLAGVLPLLTVAVIATQDLLSAGIVLATLPLIPVFGALVGLATRDRAEAQWRAMASLSGHFVDVMKGLPTLVAFRRARAQSDTIRTVTNKYRQATLRTLRIAFASSAVLELVATLSVALVAVVVGVRLAAGHLDLRTALVVLLLAPEAYWPLRRVGAEFHAAAEGVATFEQMSTLPDLEPTPGWSRVARPDHVLRATNLRFNYPGRTSPTLEDLTFATAPESVTVVVGPSGSGKSTLLALLAGLLAPTSGTVTVDGLPTASAVRQSQVAWLPQRPVFLNGTVADNLRLGAPRATDSEVWDALTRVALAERIASLGGLSAVVGEDGTNFSAGERARLALARVIVAARPWVLLDEPTAHLDPVTQQVLLDVIVELSTVAAVVVVAHDPAVLAIADQVISIPALGRGETGPRSRVVAGRPTGPAAPLVVPIEVEERPARPRFVLSTCLGVLASLSGVALTATAGWLIVKASAHPATLTLLVAIVGVRAFGLGRPVFRYVERLRSHDAALKLLADERVSVYDAVVPLTPGRLGRRRGDVLASIVDDVDAVVDDQLRIKLPIRTYAAVAAVAAATCSLILPAAGLLIGATSIAGAGLAYLIARVGSGRPERDIVASRARLSETMLEAAHLAPELRMWQAQRIVLDQVVDLNHLLGSARRAVARTLTSARAAIQLSGLAAVTAVAVVGTDALSRGAVSGPGLALLLLVPVALTDVALGVVDAGGSVPRARAARERLDAYRAMTPAVSEPASPVVLPSTHALRADRVVLGWDGTVVVPSLTLDVVEGAKLGVVGPSGSGKSTLAAALIRFIDPLAGPIELGGAALATLPLDDVRRTVGYVDDDPYVFASTLRENVRLARPGASDAEVRSALDAAHLGTWVAELPEGLDTWIGDGHAALSGGERARLGLARSLLADQPILVLDEPVAHLDQATARGLAADLLDAADGRTVVWITHSEVGLERMDRVLDLGGCISAQDVGLLNHG